MENGGFQEMFFSKPIDFIAADLSERQAQMCYHISNDHWLWLVSTQVESTDGHCLFLGMRIALLKHSPHINQRTYNRSYRSPDWVEVTNCM